MNQIKPNIRSDDGEEWLPVRKKERVQYFKKNDKHPHHLSSKFLTDLMTQNESISSGTETMFALINVNVARYVRRFT